MNSIVFVSPFLKFKNNKVYILNKYEINNKNYEEETYYIDFDDVNNKDYLTMNNKKFTYSILYNEDDKNLLIKVDFLDTLDDIDHIDDIELIKIMHYTEDIISGCDNIVDFHINDDNLKNYFNKFIRI
jgi:hypothetical protein